MQLDAGVYLFVRKDLLRACLHCSPAHLGVLRNCSVGMKCIHVMYGEAGDHVTRGHRIFRPRPEDTGNCSVFPEGKKDRQEGRIRSPIPPAGRTTNDPVVGRLNVRERDRHFRCRTNGWMRTMLRPTGRWKGQAPLTWYLVPTNPMPRMSPPRTEQSVPPSPRLFPLHSHASDDRLPLYQLPDETKEPDASVLLPEGRLHPVPKMGMDIQLSANWGLGSFMFSHVGILITAWAGTRPWRVLQQWARMWVDEVRGS